MNGNGKIQIYEGGWPRHLFDNEGNRTDSIDMAWFGETAYRFGNSIIGIGWAGGWTFAHNSDMPPDGLFGPDAVIGPWGFPGYRPPPDRLVPFTPPDISGPLPGWAAPPSIDFDPDLSEYTRPELPSLDVDPGSGTQIPAPDEIPNPWDIPIPGPARPPEWASPGFIDSLFETGGDPPTPFLVPRRVRRRGTATVESEESSGGGGVVHTGEGVVEGVASGRNLAVVIRYDKYARVITIYTKKERL